MIALRPVALAAAVGLAAAGCASAPPTEGTLAELAAMPADVEDVYLADSLERAAQSYLEETPRSALTPEAMRRLADLQLEREYGIIGGAPAARAAPEAGAELAAHRTVSIAALMDDGQGGGKPASPTPGESDADFEDRATDMSATLAASGAADTLTPDGVSQTIPAGPQEAIRTYQQILDAYPNYERNDQVLYQMSRAYDELGQPENAMEVMAQLIERYPYSKYIDEVRFRRGEFFFVRRQYLDAEDEYGAVVALGETSPYYELGRYKLGWTMYKQELYEDALHQFLAMLDYREATGYDFDTDYVAVAEGEEGDSDEHRITDTFRVISLSFSNLGGADVLSEYFARHGHRSYADKIYQNLGEFFFAKLRYDDAASVYRAFIDLNPLHRASPHFGMRVIEIFDAGGFPQLVVESKKRFATEYAVDAVYWSHHDIAESVEVVGFLKRNLSDLANHYHSLFQDDVFVEERPGHFSEATRWYRQYLESFPTDLDTPPVHYQLADLLLENEDFIGAAQEYESTAYEYGPHEQDSAAGYAAVFAYREELKRSDEAGFDEVRQATVSSSLRFADSFQQHEQAPVVLGAAADDLYAMQNFALAIESAHKLIDRYPGAPDELRLSAWAVVATASIDIEAYPEAEQAYLQVLGLTPPDDDNRPAVIDGLAASIYKQGEQSGAAGDFLAAADHFLRIRDVAPSSTIREAAEYDAAAALVKVQAWGRAADVLEGFRSEFPEHELNRDATKQLALIYREDGQLERSAAEHVRIADEADDPAVAGEALLTAGELYDEVMNVASAIQVYERYVAEHPRPLDLAVETRTRLSELFKGQSDYVRYHDELRQIVAMDRDAGAERSDRSRFLAANAALVLAELDFERFASLALTQPFEDSLAEKQRRMDDALAGFENLVDYRVATVTAAATYYIAEIYFDFSASLIESERPTGLTAAEQTDYELVIEEEAYPFEEQAIEVHEENFALLTSNGVYNGWVQKSLDKLAELMPGRYAKNELSAGFVGAIDYYAYRVPSAPAIDSVNPETGEPVRSSSADGVGSDSAVPTVPEPSEESESALISAGASE